MKLSIIKIGLLTYNNTDKGKNMLKYDVMLGNTSSYVMWMPTDPHSLLNAHMESMQPYGFVVTKKAAFHAVVLLINSPQCCQRAKGTLLASKCPWV